jgi:hypothetical protein
VNYWFLYKLDTGEIYGSPYLGSAEEWTNIPDGCGVIGPFPKDSASQEVVDAFNNSKDYKVVDGQLVHSPYVPTLDEAKQAKLAQLRQALNNAIATFQSSALGTPHTYLADEKSMTMLAAEYAFVKSPDYDGQPTPWYTVEQGRVPHTGEQIAQVFIDGRAYVKAQYAHYDNLKAQVPQATTIDQINAINW